MMRTVKKCYEILIIKIFQMYSKYTSILRTLISCKNEKNKVWIRLKSLQIHPIRYKHFFFI